MKFSNGKNTKLNQNSGTLPDVSAALLNWFQPMVFIRVLKEVINGQVSETPTPASFQGVIQPFNARQLMLKPEGQRAWSWWKLHCQPSFIVDVDEVVTYLGKQYRVMARNDYAIYGYIEYDLIEDYTGSGPT